jgi:hypothetical protein
MADWHYRSDRRRCESPPRLAAQGQAALPEAAERSHLALRRAVVDVALSLLRAGVLPHSGHADLSARVGPDAVLLAALSRRRDLGPDDLAVGRPDTDTMALEEAAEAGLRAAVLRGG